MHTPSIAATGPIRARAAAAGPAAWPWVTVSPAASAARERRDAAALPQLLADVLDAIDYGVLLVDHERALYHANRLGGAALRRGDTLRLEAGRVEPAAADGRAALAAAVRSAVERGLRTTLHLAPRCAVAVVPAAGLASGVHAMAALVLSRQGLCTPLALDAYARQHGLTDAERVVLHALARDESPERIAAANGVALCTVRSQVGGIRAKTGARSTRELLSWLARVPPMVSVVCD